MVCAEEWHPSSPPLKHNTPFLLPPSLSAWTAAGTGGMAQLGGVFPSGSVSLAWSNTGSGRLDPVTVSTVTVALAQQSVAPLNDSSPSLEVYSSSLWYEGTGPAWQAWPSSDWYAAVQPTNYAVTVPGIDPVALQLVQCSNVRATAYGANCTASTSTDTGAGGSGGAGAAAAEAAAGPPTVSASAARRSLAQFGDGETSCEVFQRVVRTPSALALELVPPRGCEAAGQPRCSAGNWSLRLLAAGCGTEDESTSVEVPEAEWIADLRSGDPPAWCANWTDIFSQGGPHGAPSALPAPPVVTLRSALDPYVQAAQITGCSYNFGPTTVQYAAFALNLVLLGCAVITCSGCCLAALVARSAAQQGARGEGSGLGGGPFAGGGVAGGYGYGSTGGYASSGGTGASYGYRRYY